jgi:Predicted restriction endonuclease
MNILKIENISNIESILPIYEINLNNASLQNTKIDSNISYTEINLNDLNNSKELINNLIEDESSYFYMDEHDIEMQDLDIVEGLEGKEQLIIHLKKERNQKLMKKCKQLFLLKDKYLHCEICNFSFYENYGDIGINFIEGHHVIPISELKAETIVKSTDILMVCSNCHRMLHRRYPCLTKEQLLELMLKNLDR